MEFNRNPLYVLGNFSWRDYQIFKSHLRLPAPYPLLVFKNYGDLHAAVVALPSIFEAHFNHLWERKKMHATQSEKRYAAAHIPPQYYPKGFYMANKQKEQADYAALVCNVDKLQNTGTQLYLYSTFGEAAMTAACELLKAAVDKGIRAYCANYTTVLDSIKKWDNLDPVITRIFSAEFLVLWAVGSEYSTEFANTNLDNLLVNRRASNQVTILVSSLNPKEYATRYGVEPRGAAVEFIDTKIKQTLADIVKAIEHG